MHDEESRNGQEVKIHILEGYIRTSERFRVIRVFFGVPESYGNAPGEVVGLNGPYGKGEKGLKGGRAPSPWTGPNWTRERGRPLPSFSFSLPFFLVGLHTLGAPYEGRPPPPFILYIRGQGAPHRHTS